LVSGADVIIANSDGSGIAWGGSDRSIRFNTGQYQAFPSSLLLRGNHTLNRPIEVADIAFISLANIGQTNDGTTPSHATFNGRIDVKETDALVLKLTADAGGSATFNGEINVKDGIHDHGFDKIGAGTVVLNGRVSEGLGDTDPIGKVNVQAGTLLINSPAAPNSFYTTGIVVANGATLGGSGNIVGNVTLSGTSAATLAPGSSIGTLTVDGDVDFDTAGVLAIEIDGNSVDRLDVTGLLDLSASDDTLALSIIGPAPNGALVIASYGSLDGVFDSVDLSVLPSCYRLDYNYLGLNQIALAVPEPAGIALLVCGAAAVTFWRKRRSRR
jgi:hypothetical protein